MQLLAVAAALDGGHHQIFRRNERQIVGNELCHDLLVDVQPFRHVLHDAQDGVHSKEGLREGDAAVGRVVQCPLEPLCRGSHGRVGRVGHDVARQRADAFTAHGIALIRHGGGADLRGLERLLDLTVVLQKADIGRKPAAALRNRGQDVQDAAVELARVGLAAHVIEPVEAEIGSDPAVHFVDLRAVAVKEREEAGLGTGRAAAAQETDGREHVVQLFHVEHQFLKPERGALSDGHKLRGLVVRIAEAGHGGVLLREVAEIRHDRCQFSAQIAQAVAVKNEVGVVGDVAARRAEVNDPLCAGGHRSEGVDVRHHVVAQLLFLRGDHVVIDGADIGGQLLDLFLRDGQAEGMLGPREAHPEPAPRFIAHVRREQVQHIFRRIARGQRAFIGGLHGATSYL